MRGFCHPFHGDRLRLVEGPEKVDGKPRMLLDERLTDAKDVHDRERCRYVSVISRLFRLVIGEETRHARVLGNKRLDEIGMKHRVEIAFGQHGFD